MEDEKLIECVKKYEFLYNLQHPKYMDGAKKEMAWKKISEQLKQPAAACKQRWQGLRDAYRRALNKKKSKSGQPAKNIKKWKYDEEMSFVASFFAVKKTLESIEPTSDGEESQNKDTETEVQNDNSINDIYNTDAVNVTAPHDTKFSNEDNTIIHNKSTQPKLEHSQAKQEKGMNCATYIPVSASTVLVSRLLDQQGSIPQQREHDELDRFFLNISETVKKFSPYLQAIAKNKIFSIVSEMELQQLAPPSFSITSPQYANTSSPASTSSCVKTRESPETWDISITNNCNQSGNVFE